MSTGFVLVTIGVILCGGAYLFAISNMLRSINDRKRSFESVFKGHLGAMGALAIGGIIATIGLVVVVANLVQNL